MLTESESLPTFALRQLGHILLCGVLHATYQTKAAVEGEYMICLLFRTYLLLATLSTNGSGYETKFAIGLSDLRIEETDNGRGKLRLSEMLRMT